MPFPFSCPFVFTPPDRKSGRRAAVPRVRAGPLRVPAGVPGAGPQPNDGVVRQHPHARPGGGHQLRGAAHHQRAGGLLQHHPPPGPRGALQALGGQHVRGHRRLPHRHQDGPGGDLGRAPGPQAPRGEGGRSWRGQQQGLLLDPRGALRHGQRLRPPPGSWVDGRALSSRVSRGVG